MKQFCCNSIGDQKNSEQYLTRLKEIDQYIKIWPIIPVFLKLRGDELFSNSEEMVE